MTGNAQDRLNRPRWPNHLLFQGGAQHRNLLPQRLPSLYLPHLPGGRHRRGLKCHHHHRAPRAYRLGCRHLVRQAPQQPLHQPRHPPLLRHLLGDLYLPLRGRALSHVLFLRYLHGGNPRCFNHSRHLRRQRRFRPYRLAASQSLLCCLRGKDQGHRLRLGGRPRLPRPRGPCHLRHLGLYPYPLHEEHRGERTLLLLLPHRQRHLSRLFALGHPLRASHRPFKEVLQPDEVWRRHPRHRHQDPLRGRGSHPRMRHLVFCHKILCPHLLSHPGDVLSPLTFPPRTGMQAHLH